MLLGVDTLDPKNKRRPTVEFASEVVFLELHQDSSCIQVSANNKDILKSPLSFVSYHTMKILVGEFEGFRLKGDH